MTPTLFIVSTFLIITLVIFCLGRLMMGVRNDFTQNAAKTKLRMGVFTFLFSSLIPTSDGKRQKLKLEMQQAGYLRRHAVAEFLAVRNATIVAWFTAMGCVIGFAMRPGDELMWPLIAAAVGWVVLFTLPSIVLSSQAQSRMERIKYSLPDALDLINMMVTGGLPFMKALERASQELKEYHPDIACELAIVTYQASAGSLKQALSEFGKRVNESEVTALATLVQHADELGGNVSRAFADYADSVRRARRQRAEERGNKASVKLLFPVVFFLAPPIYILLLGPAALEMRDFITRQSRPGGVLDQQTQVNVSRQLDDSRSQVDENQTP